MEVETHLWESVHQLSGMAVAIQTSPLDTREVIQLIKIMEGIVDVRTAAEYRGLEVQHSQDQRSQNNLSLQG